MIERATNPETERAQAQRKQILCINSHPPFLALLQAILQGEQFNVTTTTYVPHIFDLIKALKPALVIVDLVEYQLAGWELLDQLHQQTETSGIPLLLTSTDPDLLDHARIEAAQYGKHRGLIYPFKIETLLRAIDDLIGTA
jgi:CheY-like chemotaxis protein